MPVKLNSTGGGSVTLTTPSTASDFTVTIPAATGTMVTTTSASTIEFAAGSAAAPSITTTGDTNNGIFFPAADTVAISTAGTEDFRIGPAGQIGLQGANYGTSGQVLTSNGSAAAPSWQTAGGGQIQTQIFAASGNWVAPTGVTQIRILASGAGGGGGGGQNANCGATGGGGGGGGQVYGLITVTPGTNYTVTIGLGGAGGGYANPGNNGAAGGTTSFGALVSCTGGGGGIGGARAGNANNGTATLTGTTLRNVPYIGTNRTVYAGYEAPAANVARQAWTTTGNYNFGAGGNGGRPACNPGDPHGGGGGVDGLVVLEWVGG